MKRDEAVTYLKEVLNSCEHMSPKAVSFEKSKVSDISTGYKIRIKGSIQEADKQMIKNIAQKYRLAVKEVNDELIIYRPKPISKLL